MDSLKTLIQLEQQRERLQLELSVVLRRVELLQLGLFAPTRSTLYAAQASSQDSPHRAVKGTSQITPRGELRDKLFNLLNKAGDHGIIVKTISPLLGIKPVNLHSWFHSAMRRYPEIEKIAPGHYRLTPALAANAEKTSPQFRKLRAGSRMRPKRGETTRRILKTLAQAGNEGIGAREIAKRIGTHYRNIHVWLASTGKRTNQIERIARGIYRMKSTEENNHEAKQSPSPSDNESATRRS